MSDVLAEIYESQKKHLEQSKKELSLRDLEDKIRSASAPVDFLKAIEGTKSISVIAEMKQKSPSAGTLREPYDVKNIAKLYKKGGAAALSVLTEPYHFGGRVEDMMLAKDMSHLPILRKDFLFDPYQIVEARAFGASAVLLIADMLDLNQLKELVSTAHELDLDVLVEGFHRDSINKAVKSGSRLVGINSRNLRTLEMVPGNIASLIKEIPDDFTVVAESGVKSVEQVKEFKRIRVSAMLVGESLLKQQDLEKAVRTLVEAGR